MLIQTNMIRTTYDYIIAGGGAAGLSLAYYLSQSSLQNKRILIIDRDEKTKNDRTWCFWTKEQTAFGAIVTCDWQHLHFFDDKGTVPLDLKPYRYQLIRGIDFYNFIKTALAKFPNIEWLHAEIEAVQEDAKSPFVLANGQQHRAHWIFDSTFGWQQWQAQAQNGTFLLQHFLGWVVETETATFDPCTPHFMDFRTAQHGDARFFYVLPFSETKALVEYTIFSKDVLEKSAYREQLEKCLQQKLHVSNYNIAEEEYGVIPMTDAPLPHPGGRHIVRIGTAGGGVKPSTGYAFLNLQRQMQALVRRLEQGKTPFIPTQKLRFQWYDKLLLNILSTEGNSIKIIFSQLFRRNRIQQVFKFLDERTSMWQEIRIFWSLPWLPFLRAIGRTQFKHLNTAKK
jgi:lycopene beta-cyclase